MGKINYPKINKKIQDFIYEEEGNISRDKVLFIGSMLVVLAAMIPSRAFAGHSSHASHESHASHVSSSTGANDYSTNSSTSGSSNSGATQSSSNVASSSNSSSNTAASANSNGYSNVPAETPTKVPGTPEIPDATPNF